MNFRDAFVDEMQKLAIIGPLLDIGDLGIPSAIGYIAGRGTPMDKQEAREVLNMGTGEKVLKYGFIPGYTGWRHARKGMARKVLHREE